MQFCCFILLPRSALPDLRVQVRVGAGAAATIAATIAAAFCTTRRPAANYETLANLVLKA